MQPAAQRAVELTREPDALMSKRLSDTEIERQDWRESRQLVMRTLERVELKLEDIDEKVGGRMTSLEVKVATIDTRVAVYAAMIALVVATVFGILGSVITSYIMRK